MSKELHDKTWNYYVSIGLIPENTSHYDYVLHHIDVNLKYTNPERYNEWRIEDVIPLTWAEHNKIHKAGVSHENYNLGGYKWSDEAKEKVSGTNNHNSSGLSESHKKNISKACLENNSHKGEKNGMYGKHNSRGKQTNRTKRHWTLEDGKRKYY